MIYLTHYDVLIIGSGTGYKLATKVAKLGQRVAIVDRDPLGGTCPNRGCIPSKMWITVADRIREAEDTAKLGAELVLESVDFPTIRERTLEGITSRQVRKMEGVAGDPNIDHFHGVGTFIGPKTLRVNDQEITADKVVIASGARPAIPPIDGLEEVGYLTNRNVFDIDSLPNSLIIVGGGYIACEFAHFFSALGCKVTLLGRNQRLLPRAEADVSKAVLDGLSEHVHVYTGIEVLRARMDGNLKVVIARDHATGEEVRFAGQQIMVATGRRSNSDLLKPEVTGVEVDDRGWVRTNEFLETNVKGIWAMGDAVNRGAFRHTADMHQRIVFLNAFKGERRAVDEHAIPSAVFTWPQVGSVGMTEEEAKDKGLHYHVGRMRYDDTAKGIALLEDTGFIKVIVEADTERILGAHMVGHDASTLIQQIVTVMNAGEGTYEPFKWTQPIHPTLSEVVSWVFLHVQHPADELELEKGES